MRDPKLLAAVSRLADRKAGEEVTVEGTRRELAEAVIVANRDGWPMRDIAEVAHLHLTSVYRIIHGTQYAHQQTRKAVEPSGVPSGKV